MDLFLVWLWWNLGLKAAVLKTLSFSWQTQEYKTVIIVCYRRQLKKERQDVTIVVTLEWYMCAGYPRPYAINEASSTGCSNDKVNIGHKTVTLRYSNEPHITTAPQRSVAYNQTKIQLRNTLIMFIHQQCCYKHKFSLM